MTIVTLLHRRFLASVIMIILAKPVVEHICCRPVPSAYVQLTTGRFTNYGVTRSPGCRSVTD